MMRNLLDAVRLARESTEAWFSGPVDPRVVDEAERRLNVVLPPTYRRFLEELGTGNVGPNEVYGIVPSGLGVPNAIWVTEHGREEFGFVEDLVIIGDTSFGEFYALDTAATIAGVEPGESPVVVVALTPGGEHSEVVASDFGQFFLDRVVEALGHS